MSKFPMFTEKTQHRSVNFMMKMSQEEHDFLKEEADRRGIHMSTLVRQLIAGSLLNPKTAKVMADGGE